MNNTTAPQISHNLVNANQNVAQKNAQQPLQLNQANLHIIFFFFF